MKSIFSRTYMDDFVGWASKHDNKQILDALSRFPECLNAQDNVIYTIFYFNRA